MPQGVAFDVFLSGTGAFSLVSRFSLHRADGVVVDLAAFADAHHVSRLVSVQTAAVADAPISDEPFHAFAGAILYLAANGRRRSVFAVASRRLHPFAGHRIDAGDGSGSQAFAADDVAVGPVSDLPFRAGGFPVAWFRRRRSSAALDPAVTFVDESVDVAAQKLPTENGPEPNAGISASRGAGAPLADVPIRRTRMRIAGAVRLRLQFRFAEMLFRDFVRVGLGARNGANLESAAAGLRASAPARGIYVPGEGRNGVVLHPLVEHVELRQAWP